MDDRAVLTELLKILTRHINIGSEASHDAERRIAAIPASELPKVRETIMRCREILLNTTYLDDAVVEITKVACGAANVEGFTRGVYVGWVQSWVSRPENHNALLEIGQQSLALIDGQYPRT